jgi:PAS domain S-box-containing protein
MWLLTLYFSRVWEIRLPVAVLRRRPRPPGPWEAKYVPARSSTYGVSWVLPAGESSLAQGGIFSARLESSSKLPKSGIEMQKLRDRPVRQKITFVIMMIAGVVLLPTFAALFCFQAYTLKQHSAHELAVVGEITAHNCAAAVMFKDEDAAAQILGGLRTMPQIVSGRLELVDQQRLASFGAGRDEAEIKTARLKSGFRINGDRILLAQPVMLSGTREGTLYLLADLHAMTSQLLKLYGGIFALVLVGSLLVAFVLSSQFLRFITDPILRLAGTARTIADHNDYSVRANKVCGDEVGVLTDAFNQMLAQIQSQDSALRKAEEKYRLIFEDAIEGIFQTTPDGKYLSANPALARMYGYESPEELMKSVSDIGRVVYVDPRRRNEFKRRIEIQGFVELFEYEVYRKDRSKIWLCENARAVRDATGAILYYEGTVEDITQRKRVEEVERANKAKSEFLSRVSHELRTPLNAILGFGQLLERQNPTETQRPRIRHILSAGKHLLGLINEVLDISRIESGRMQLSLEPVCAADALTEALDLMRPLAAQRSVQFSTLASFDNSVFVLADRQRFKQVLLNLLANAVKYTPVSGTVSVSHNANGDENVRIVVHDTGPGIPNEKLERLFTPFERLGAEQSNVEGTGLGLALSQRLMQAMGGSIGVESTVGKGSTFWLELPRTKSPLQELPLREVNGDGRRACSKSANRKILYIEDNLSNLTLIEQMLEERPEIELLTAMQGKLGLDLARQHSPDLILLDVHLPDLDGREVISELKSSDTTRDIPVVVISADATTHQIDRLVTAGADSYLTKPLDVANFFQVLDKTTAANNGKSSATTARSNRHLTEVRS